MSQPTASSVDLRVECLTELERVLELGEPWDRLLRVVGYASAAQSFEYAVAGWQSMPAVRETRLAVIAIWRGQTLECVWPLYVRRDGWKMVAYHLGSSSNEEYAGPLIHSDNPAEVFDLALMRAKSLSDMLKVFNVSEASPAYRQLCANPTFRHRGHARSPVVRVKGVADMDTWLATKSRSFRQGLRADRRRLGALGDVRFVRMAGPVDGPACVDWIFEQKRRWLKGRARHPSWINEAQGRVFFTSLASEPAHDVIGVGDVLVHALKAGDITLAASICLMSADKVEFYVMAVNPEYGAYSPGSLLTQDCLDLAIQRGVDFDFRITGDAYKMRWIDGYDHYEGFWIACTAKGYVALVIDKIRIGIRAFRAANGPKLKAMLRKLRS